ncbi:MAG: sigma-70 family RNA polymerase sigma factor [Verrucomicrobia bacterium]|nr:sigma-70 family RNA polymerase sigma factor [Verrucomicrobiota bacterium]
MISQDASEASTVATPTPGDIFATTRWTVVLSAGRKSSPQADMALEELCRTYWYPLYAYVRRQGHSKEDAEDLTQAFFARFLEKNYLEGLSAERGKFRAFLLASLKHFLANEWDRTHRQKRGGGVAPLSLDWQDADTRYQIDPADTLSPDKLFDRAWAVTLLERVVARLRDESVAEGKTKLFEQLKPFLMVGRNAIPYAPTAAELGLTEGAVRVAVHRLRQRYRELLRAEIAQTLADPAAVEEEMRALFSAFAE